MYLIPVNFSETLLFLFFMLNSNRNILKANFNLPNVFIYGIAIKRKKREALESVQEASITQRDGIIGDCRGGGGTLHRRQITVISLEQWEEACREIRLELPFFARRSNICVSGYSFGPQDKGKKFYAGSGGVVLEITGETEPCSRMDEVAPGLQKALAPNWRGGVTCRVVYGGEIKTNQISSIV